MKSLRFGIGDILQNVTMEMGNEVRSGDKFTAWQFDCAKKIKKNFFLSFLLLLIQLIMEPFLSVNVHMSDWWESLLASRLAKLILLMIYKLIKDHSLQLKGAQMVYDLVHVVAILHRCIVCF